MDEEHVDQYLERLKKREQTFLQDTKFTSDILESAGIYDENGNLTDKYRD